MTTSTARETAAETEIGKYHLVAELARGGMGNVYLAVARGPGGFNKLVVVKELKPELDDDQTYVAMFLDEARLAARLIHPNIVQTNEVASDGGRHYMVMEFLDGRSLHRVIKRLGSRLPLGAHLRVISEVLLGLHYAHELRAFDGSALEIVHRDVSPLNVFVTFAGQAKVLDFGIAKAVDSSLETQMGVLKGRIAYMAPEQAKGTKVDRRADIYSAGVMLWEAATGRRLWQGLTEVEILTHLLREGAPSPRDVDPGVPRDLEQVCVRALASRREDRYATAAEMLVELEAHMSTRDDNLSMRDLGSLVARTFDDERCRMNAVVEEALGRVRGDARSGTMPTLQAQVSGTPTDARIEARPSTSLVMPTIGSGFLQWGPTSSVGSLSHSAPATTATLGSALAPQGPRGLDKRRAAILATGALALIVGGGLFGAALRTAKPPGGAVVTAAAPPLLGATTGAPQAPATIDLVVRVSPATASITIDGAVVVSNPLYARYPRDAQIHHLSAEAEGYDSKVEDVSFTTDVAIDISLNRRPAPPRPSLPYAPSPAAPAHAPRKTPPPPSTTSAPEAPAVPAAAGSEVGPQGGRAPLRPIATANPYEP